MPLSSVCIGQNLTVNADQQLQLAPWSVPRLLADVKAVSGGDGKLTETIYPPGKKLIDQQLTWKNITPVDFTVLIRVIRRYKAWIVSNPNAIQFRDRWNWAVNASAPEPTVTGLYNGQCGSAGDLGTNTVAAPNPGLFHHWMGTTTADEWIWDPVTVGDSLSVWYQAYVWTPPPWSNNANKNSPQHKAEAGWTRIQLWGFPQQGALVTGG